MFYIIGLTLLYSLLTTIYRGRYSVALRTFGAGGGGGGKDAPEPTMPVVQPVAAAPTSTDATTAAAVQASQQSRAAAAGLASTDVTQGALAGNPGLLTSSNKPTLLGG